MSTRKGSGRKVLLKFNTARRFWPALALSAALSLALAAPAHAQFSEGYKFLEAVRKKEGEKVESALSEPGSTIVNTRDVTSGQTALHIVTARRDLTWLNYLIAKGANVNASDTHGQTPLQIATNLGWHEGVEALVAAKAMPDQSNDAGETPLITAVHRRDTQLMRILLAVGADPDRADNSGRSARDYAKLDGDDSQLVSTIETYTKKDAIRKSGPVYGPTLP